jgi:hypothetical protein
MSDAWRERVATILEIIARDRLPNPHDLDVALDAIECETADEIERLRVERDRLRNLLSLAEAKLSEGRLFIGYGNVGPLHDQATAIIIQRARAALKENEQ